jgi:hypothetical protein
MRQINGDSKVTRMARKRKRCVAPFSTFKPREIADNQVGCVDYFRKRRRESSRRLGSRFDSPVGPRFNKECPPSPAAAISKPKTNAGTSITATSESARCGFYPGCHPRERTHGTAATFDQARADFEEAWRVFLSNRTEADFQEWRAYRPSPRGNIECGTPAIDFRRRPRMAGRPAFAAPP